MFWEVKYGTVHTGLCLQTITVRRQPSRIPVVYGTAKTYSGGTTKKPFWRRDLALELPSKQWYLDAFLEENTKARQSVAKIQGDPKMQFDSGPQNVERSFQARIYRLMLDVSTPYDAAQHHVMLSPPSIQAACELGLNSLLENAGGFDPKQARKKRNPSRQAKELKQRIAKRPMGLPVFAKAFRLRLLLHKSSFFALLLVFSSSPLKCNGSYFWQLYDGNQLNALQAVWGAWNESTPDPAKNLAGWNSSQPYPCSQGSSQQKSNPNWRGVQCLDNVACTNNASTGDTTCYTYITGLTLDKASIVGILPSELGSINTLTTLELTGNPDLNGALPDTLKSLPDLYNLDLHDNDFSGEIPDFQNLRNVNLRGNRFSSSGTFPLPTMFSKGLAQTVSLASNDLDGPIPKDAFQYLSQLVELDLSHNRFKGIPPTLSNVTSLEVLDLSYNNFSGTLPDLTTVVGLRSVNLSGNAFTGSALGFWNSSELQELKLDSTSIDGSLNISDLSVRGLLSMKTSNSTGQLRVLSLMNNSIRDVIFDVKEIEDFTTIISLQGNPYCNTTHPDDGTRCFCTQVCKHTAEDAARAMARKRKLHNVVIIAVVTSVSSLLVLLAGLAAFYHRSKEYRQLCEIQLQKKCEEFEVQPTIFPYNQLRIATRDFHPDMKLGQGSFGAVYKGILPNGNEVAVKQLFAKTSQSTDEFLNEVVLLTGMKHRNLVNLKGCCTGGPQRLLVYEYVDNYDIDKILLRPNQGTSKVLLSWAIRLKICLGVARGLHYLHDLGQKRIFHRDIKPSNILLSKNYETKIADFGLAFLFPNEESYILTKHVAGTKGYLAPEYALYGQLSDKVDVYSFGILCLEVVSGRRIIDETLESNKTHLPKWAWYLHQQGNLIELIDPSMSLQQEEKLEVHRLINIALLCIQNKAELRPRIEQVVAMLQGERDYQAMTLTSGMDEQYLESLELLAFGNNNLATLEEESEFPFINSSRRVVGNSWRDSSPSGVFEHSEIRV